MKWLTSLNELLYEVMSWLLFFPITLWRAVVHPLDTMAQVERQSSLPEDERYSELLSPPLFLTLGLLLAHGVSMALGLADAIIANQRGLASLVTDASTALVLRAIVFASFPLFLGARLVRRRRQPLTRSTLRGPFYAQGYPGAVLALGASIGTSLATLPDPRLTVLGGLLIVASLSHFSIVETRWFADHSDSGHARAAASIAFGVFEGIAFVLFVGFLFTR